MDKQLGYEAFRELFKYLGINPYEFRQLSGDRLTGYFPNLEDRKPLINVQDLVNVLWKEG